VEFFCNGFWLQFQRGGLGWLHCVVWNLGFKLAWLMAVYLREAVAKKRAERGTAFSHKDLLQAAKDGARLRRRPKVMTVTTIVASLLPILWSNRAGAEVMKPSAAPIIGGMVSSLACTLIITPVIFTWLRERKLKRRSWNLAFYVLGINPHV
jgi:Cu(I)/Ag(I) efflux system membrane protein CusA/SilA